MIKNQQNILDFIIKNPEISSKQIHENFSEISYATVKRILQKLVSDGLIVSNDKGKNTTYSISINYEFLQEIDVNQYFENEIDDRIIKNNFNFELINSLQKIEIFSNKELEILNNLQNKYLENSSKLSKNQYDKELERLAIDLSWKSSQIEGNTYSLLETEKLLKDKQTAAGKTKDEATMLLNHKEVIDFIIENPTYIFPLSVSKIEDIHRFLTKELNIDKNIRKHRVGISGTNYLPLDNEFQIKEALENSCNLIENTINIFEKSFLILLLLSYIQPFADGNKRTARIISNTILMKNNYCPISFRTVDSIEYKKAMLIFYEQNNLSAFKKIFIDQFQFAVNTYF